MSKTLTTYQILEMVDKEPNKAEKIALLRQNRNATIDKLFKLTYDTSIVFDLPESEPPFKKNDLLEYGSFASELKRFERVFLKGLTPNFKQAKRESLFIQVLEYLHPDDSKLMIGIITRQSPFKSLNKKFILEALPELFSNEKV